MLPHVKIKIEGWDSVVHCAKHGEIYSVPYNVFEYHSKRYITQEYCVCHKCAKEMELSPHIRATLAKKSNHIRRRRFLQTNRT